MSKTSTKPKKRYRKARKIPGAPWVEVRQSQVHGRGVFAIRDIPKDTLIIEYTGRRISAEEADAMWPVDPDDPYHTFFFSLSSGETIDGGTKGNAAKWINHSCEPNCEAREGKNGYRVYIYSLRDIKQGEELSFDYGLIIDDELTETLKSHYRCCCGSKQCRGTMLNLASFEEGAEDAD
ncbi:SET domain-containing protein [Oligella urethralis]|uniref:SET domain-containing protein n=1 Tax=Oligella urethralis TaxID=90245 RepID=UPI000C999D52|nr:SET domain-containing protein [Oligella urethralis]MDK6203498.1 SET domain-containing protein [Oligella urethralis]PMC17003.1 SET domain-containing protein-lysine N-methyltransferase [Oligella urethralis]